MRQSGLMWLMCVAIGLLSAEGAFAGQTEIQALIRGVEHRYNAARTLSVSFTETYRIAGRERAPESGRLVLRKPGRMRWTYTQPEGKLFVSDGKEVYLYTSQDNRVEKSTLKASDDLRAPMAFLLGKLNLQKEFRDFETRGGTGGTWLEGKAANDRLPYESVAMLIAPDYSIRELKITGRDESVLSFTFSDETVNPRVSDGLFAFAIPAGAEVVNAVNTGEN
jgi:outer membrane lipoprotein carrier protein